MNPSVNIWNYLSNAWKKYWEKQEILKFWEGLLRLSADMKLSAMQADRSKSLVTISELWTEEWLRVGLDESTYNNYRTLPRFPYAFSLEALIRYLPQLVDYPTNEQTQYLPLVDYAFNNKIIYFKDDPRPLSLSEVFFDPDAPNPATAEYTIQPRRIDTRLYSPRAKYETNILYNNFGGSVDFEKSGLNDYKKEVQGIYYCISEGPTVRSLTYLLNILFGSNVGFPFAYESDIIKEVSPGTYYTTVITVNKRYRIPYFLNPLLEVAPDPFPANFDESTPGRVREFQPLTDAIKIHDGSISDEWFDTDNTEKISFGKYLLYLDAIRRGGYNIGTLDDNGPWDDGEEVIFRREQYTTHLDDVIPPTPILDPFSFDDGGYLDDPAGDWDEIERKVRVDKNLINQTFDLVKDRTTVAEIDKHAFVRTTVNLNDYGNVFRHINVFINNTVKNLYLKPQDGYIRPEDRKDYGVKEVFTSDIYYDVTEAAVISDLQDPVTSYTTTYTDNTVEYRRRRNVEYNPVDIENRFNTVKKVVSPGTNLLAVTKEDVVDIMPKTVEGELKIFVGAEIFPYDGVMDTDNRVDEEGRGIGETFDDWRDSIEDLWDVDPWDLYRRVCPNLECSLFSIEVFQYDYVCGGTVPDPEDPAEVIPCPTRLDLITPGLGRALRYWDTSLGEFGWELVRYNTW